MPGVIQKRRTCRSVHRYHMQYDKNIVYVSICIVHERKASPFENKNMPFPSFSGVWAKLESHNKIMDGLKYTNYKIL